MATLPRPSVVLAAALSALAACGDDLPEPEPLVVATASGGRADLSVTTWQQCQDAVPAPGQSQRLRIVVGRDGAISYVFTPYASAACGSGEGQTLPPFGFLAFAAGDRVVAWSGTPPAGAPAAPVATRVFLDAGAGFSTEALWLDDVAVPRKLYISPDGNVPVDPEGYPALLSAQPLDEVL
jgi:hypothetical protein